MPTALPLASRRRHALAAALLLCASLGAAAGPEPPFVMGTDQPESSFYGRWLRLLYTEAFRRLGQPLQIIHMPTPRLAAQMDQGSIDGDAARARAYSAAHPQAIRVEESILEANFVLFTADPGLRLAGLQDLSARPLRAVYRRGVVFCERTLKGLQPAERLLDVTDTTQGLNMLAAGRAEVFCDLDASIRQALGDQAVRQPGAVRLLLMLDEANNYAYVHPRRAALAPRLAAVLKQMKAEGLLERYRIEARQPAEAK